MYTFRNVNVEGREEQDVRGRRTKAYDVIIQKCPNSHAKIQDSKMHIL